MPSVEKAGGYIAMCILCCVRCVSAYKAWHGLAINNAPSLSRPVVRKILRRATFNSNHKLQDTPCYIEKSKSTIKKCAALTLPADTIFNMTIPYQFSLVNLRITMLFGKFD